MLSGTYTGQQGSTSEKYPFAAFHTAVVLVRRPANPAIHRARKFDDQGQHALRRPAVTRYLFLHIFRFPLLSPTALRSTLASFPKTLRRTPVVSTSTFLFRYRCILLAVRLYIVALRREPKLLKICNPTIAHHVGQAHSVGRRHFASTTGQPGNYEHGVKVYKMS